MPSANRRLITGPYCANLRDAALRENRPGELWIAPSDLSREQIVVFLSTHGTDDPHVLTWDDLWAAVVAHHKNPPPLLSDAMTRAALIEAIARVERGDDLGPLADVVNTPGFRHRMKRRISAWTTAERKPELAPPRDDEITLAEWAIYRRYRSLLREQGYEDAAGLAVWASKRVSQDALANPHGLTFLDPVAPSPAQYRMIEKAAQSGLPVRVILPTSGDQFGDDPAITILRNKLLEELGFEDEAYEPDERTDLGIIESTLFHENVPFPRKSEFAGLKLRQGPRGDAQGLLLAREVKRCIEEGIDLDDILVLFKHWNDDTKRTQEILKSWEIPVSGTPAHALAVEPAISAILLAVTVALNGWEILPVVRLLRNGQLGFASADARATCASALQSLRVYRGRERLERGLDEAYACAGEPERSRIRSAQSVFRSLTQTLEKITADQFASWAEHASRLETIARELGIGVRSRDADVLEFLWCALSEHCWLSGEEQPEISFADFFKSVELIAREISVPAETARPGTVRFLSVNDATGTRARVIALTQLEEGTFPSRGAVGSGAGDDVLEAETITFARERLQFLHVLGSASDEAILLAPTSDEKGQDVLAAGFVDDLVRKLGKSARSKCVTTLARLDPTFREHPDLAVAPADRRVLATARACLDRDTAPLLSLVRDPEQAEYLQAVAESLRLQYDRQRVRVFNVFDGMLRDEQVVAELQRRLGPEHTFSASALESLALCPFQFFQRHVLRIEPTENGDDLVVDYASHGARVHDILEHVHTTLHAEGNDASDTERLEVLVQAEVEIEVDAASLEDGIAAGLRAIEDEVIKRTLREYANQYETYRQKEGKVAAPSRFEVDFGRPGSNPEALPGLELGELDELVRVSGKIDRIDVYESENGSAFRIIDYKTGKAPSKKMVNQQLLALQLPLYALAAEQLLGLDSASERDFGYWSLRKDGFKSVTPVGKKDGTWDELKQRLIDEVARLVHSARHGEFPVQPRNEQCTRSCEFRNVCRIGEVKRVQKSVVNLTVND